MKSATSALLGVLLAVIALTTAPTASAHAVRIATDPAVDAVLATGPPQVSATFNEHLQTAFAAMTVVGPDGNLWSTGEPRVQGAVISIDVMPLGPAGTYTANYRVTSADGHVVYRFLAVPLDHSRHRPPWGRRPPRRPATQEDIRCGRSLAAAAVLAVGGVWWAFRADGRKCADSKDFDAIGLDQVRSRSRTAPCARESRGRCHPRLAASARPHLANSKVNNNKQQQA